MIICIRNAFLFLFLKGLVLSPLVFASEGQDSLLPLPSYGMKAYRQLFEKIQKISDDNELKSCVKGFVKQYEADLTLPVFFEQVLNARSEGEISLEKVEQITDLIKSWLVPNQDENLLLTTSSVPKEQEEGSEIFSPSPQVIQDYLNQRIVGEPEAMEALAVYVDRHYQSLRINQLIQKTGLNIAPIKKMNLLLVGPTGSGKTASVQHLAKLLNRPFFTGDVSTFSRTGYMGDSADSVIHGLLKSCCYRVGDAEKGIVFLDEIDKVAAKTTSSYRDIGGSDVQSELLKLMEGKEVIVRVKNLGDEKMYTVNTQNILFIGGGSFSELPPKKGPHTISDFINIGFKPELLGRFGEMIFLSPLTKEKILQILNSPIISPLQQNKILLKLGYKIQLQFDESCYPAIVEKSFNLGTGVRGIYTIVDRIIQPILSDTETYKGKTVTIDGSMIEKVFKDSLKDVTKEPWESMYS